MAKTRYYRYYNPNQGERLFKVRDFKDVVQLVCKTQPKKGRPYQRGINLMRYNTFIGSWGWKMDESRYLVQITKQEFDKEFDKLVTKLRK